MIENIIEERKKKLQKIKDLGINPYPARVNRGLPINEILNNFINLLSDQKEVSLIGRIFSIRGQGSLIFLDIKDFYGKIQILLKKDSLLDFDNIVSYLDRGDFINIKGVAYETKRGEKSIIANELKLISKSLLPLPTEWFGIEDKEILLRERYLDIILNEDSKNIFIKKNIFWQTIRRYLEDSGFLEIENPVLEPIPGGAEAEPFTTHHNALDWDFYLRISLELPLKKLLVAGYEKVFEIGRVFRNEGIDAEHLQDYTQCEFYWSFSDYNELMPFVEKLYKKIVLNVSGSYITKYKNQEINWDNAWPKIDFYEIFKEKIGLDLQLVSEEDLKNKAKEHNIKFEENQGKGRLIDLLYKKLIRPELIQPCFLINPPVIIEPLAKKMDSNEDRVERMQIIACGSELGKGFSELNDPIDQRSRFEYQMSLREAGDKEAQMLDEDFLKALEYGMPPACGFGLSERLFSILLDKPIRECVTFPSMRPKNNS